MINSDEEMKKFMQGFAWKAPTSRFQNVTDCPPPLHEYVIVRKDGWMTITRWRDGRWDINSDKMPWFKKNNRIRQNVQPDEWMPLPG